jgi:hypothetical protein
MPARGASAAQRDRRRIVWFRRRVHGRRASRDGSGRSPRPGPVVRRVQRVVLCDVGEDGAARERGAWRHQFHHQQRFKRGLVRQWMCASCHP